MKFQKYPINKSNSISLHEGKSPISSKIVNKTNIVIFGDSHCRGLPSVILQQSKISVKLVGYTQLNAKTAQNLLKIKEVSQSLDS